MHSFVFYEDKARFGELLNEKEWKNSSLKTEVRSKKRAKRKNHQYISPAQKIATRKYMQDWLQ